MCQAEKVLHWLSTCLCLHPQREKPGTFKYRTPALPYILTSSFCTASKAARCMMNQCFKAQLFLQGHIQPKRGTWFWDPFHSGIPGWAYQLLGWITNKLILSFQQSYWSWRPSFIYWQKWGKNKKGKTFRDSVYLSILIKTQTHQGSKGSLLQIKK